MLIVFFAKISPHKRSGCWFFLLNICLWEYLQVQITLTAPSRWSRFSRVILLLPSRLSSCWPPPRAGPPPLPRPLIPKQEMDDRDAQDHSLSSSGRYGLWKECDILRQAGFIKISSSKFKNLEFDIFMFLKPDHSTLFVWERNALINKP